MESPACLAVCTLMSNLALAQGTGDAPPARPGPILQGWTSAVGLGYGLGFGDLYAPPDLDSPFPNSDYINPSLRGNVAGHLPVSIGFGYRPSRFLSFGGTIEFAHVFVKDCASSECSSSDLRLGAELRFHITPDRRLSPWISLGLGYEKYHLQIGNPSRDYSREVGLAGYDLDLQIGAGIRVTRLMTIGPYVGLRVGAYGNFRFQDSSRGGGPRVDIDIPDASRVMHQWLTFGARGAFTFATD